MKKLLFLFSVIVMMTLASCGGNNAAVESINQKIQNNEEITQADYKVMIDYIKTPLEESMKLVQELAANPDKMADLSKKAAEIDAKYPYCETFAIYLQQNLSQLDEANMKEFGKLQEILQKMTPQ